MHGHAAGGSVKRPVSLADVVLLVALGVTLAAAFSRHSLYQYCRASNRAEADCRAAIYGK